MLEKINLKWVTRIGSLNTFIFLLLFTNIIVFFLLIKFELPYYFIAISLLFFLIIIAFGIHKYEKYVPLPVPSPPVLDINLQEQRLKLTNYTDKLNELAPALRMLLTGGYRALEPDGKVIGDPKDNEISFYEEKEKVAYKEKLEREVLGKKDAIKSEIKRLESQINDLNQYEKDK